MEYSRMRAYKTSRIKYRRSRNPQRDSQLPKLPPTTVSTILSPIERVRVDSAADGMYTAIHRSSVDEVVQDIRSQKAEAILLSVSYYDQANTERMAAVVREFPRVPAYGLITPDRKLNPHSVLSLGKAGVRSLIDACSPDGWETLRTLLFNEQANDLQRRAWDTISADLEGVPPDCLQFFEILICYYPPVANARQLAQLVQVLPSTLLSRFYRLKLPSPKQYIDFVRLVRAAIMFEDAGLSVSSVAQHLKYSSSQAFSRHIRGVLGLSPVEFRRQYTGESMLQLFRDRLVLPHVEMLRDFHPIAADPGWFSAVLASGDSSTDKYLDDS